MKIHVMFLVFFQTTQLTSGYTGTFEQNTWLPHGAILLKSIIFNRGIRRNIDKQPHAQ